MRILTLLCMILLAGCSTAQMKYSSKSGSAVKSFEKALEAPRERDPNTGRENFAGGLKLLDDALKKDPNFWEAHVLAAEYAEQLGDFPSAMKHYREALRINPTHSPSGATLFYLGNLEYQAGEFENAIRTLNAFVQIQSANPDNVNKAYGMIQAAELAIESLKNPMKFEPINIGPGINTADPEYFPTITVDGKTILFTRRIDDKAPNGQAYEQEDFYVSMLSDKGAWQTAIAMPKNINTPYNEGAPTIGADGRSLIFVACAMGDFNEYGENRKGAGSCDLFVTKRLGSRWTDPVNIPGKINTASWESQPSLSADGKTIYFIRRVSKQGTAQDSDIYTATLQPDGSWGPATRLSNNINTPFKEESVLIHPDGRTLYFASRGHRGFGGLDLYVSRMDALGNWGPPENLGYPINTPSDENSLLVTADGEIALFASDRAGGYGDLDIYYFEMPERLRPTKTLYFDGLVYDVDTKKPLAGKFSLIDLKTGLEVVRSEADAVNGSFTVSLPVDRDYALKVSFPNYSDFSANFNMTIPEDQEAIHMDVPMVPNTDLAKERPLKNVFFDLGSANLRSESYVELNNLRDWLNENPTLKIELGGHTDTRGEAAENQVLSQNRAKAVYDYLIKQGIAAARLTYKGYGETQTIVSDEAIAKLPTEKAREKAHQENRRTVYKIIK